MIGERGTFHTVPWYDRLSTQQQHAGSVELTLLQVYFTWKYIGNSHTRTRRRHHRCTNAGVAVHPHYSVVGCGSSPCFQPVLTVVVVLKQRSLIIHTSRDLLQQSVLVDYCCFHLASGASTALGSYIGHRNKRRLLSTLREEFVEKKYKVFDIIGLLLILSQVNPSSPVERV